MSKNLTRRSLLFLGLGLSVFYVSTSGVSYMTKEFPSNIVTTMLKSSETYLYIFSYVLMVPSLFLLIFKDFILTMWEDYLRIPFNDFNAISNKHLEGMTKSIGEIDTAITEFLKIRSMPSSLLTCHSPKDYETLSTEAAKGYLGCNVVQNDSLYKYISNRILKPYSCEPYKEHVIKKVNISRFQSEDYLFQSEDYLSWQETTEYFIRNIPLETLTIQAFYNLIHFSDMNVPDLTLDSFLEHLSLSVIIDDIERVRTKDRPTTVESLDYGVNGYYCCKKDSLVRYIFQDNIQLTRDLMKVYIRDESINVCDDNTYTLINHKPVFNYSIEITIPEDFVFMDNYIGPKYALNALPEMAKKDMNIDQIIQVNHEKPNRLRININDWILPGIMLSVNWREKRTGLKARFLSKICLASL